MHACERMWYIHIDKNVFIKRYPQPLFKYVNESSPRLWIIDGGASSVKQYLNFNGVKVPQINKSIIKQSLQRAIRESRKIHRQAFMQRSFHWMYKNWQRLMQYVLKTHSHKIQIRDSVCFNCMHWKRISITHHCMKICISKTFKHILFLCRKKSLWFHWRVTIGVIKSLLKTKFHH